MCRVEKWTVLTIEFEDGRIISVVANDGDVIRLEKCGHG